MKIWSRDSGRCRGLLTALFAAILHGATAFGATATIDPVSYLNDIKFLASPELRGRVTGSPELEKAAAFIAAKYRGFGLKPVEGTHYYQPFPVTTGAQLGHSNRFHFTENGRATALHFPEDFIPFNFSHTGKLAGTVVFAGYGITAPEYNYDDYAGIDVKGKIVMVLRHEPQESDEKSVFDGKSLTPHAQFTSKATNAKIHGAIGVILINDLANHHGEADTLEKFGISAGPVDAGIPFVQVKADRVAGWFTDAGKNPATIAEGIDKDLKPQSFAFPDSVRVEANLDIQRAVKTVNNVIAYIPGETDEYLIVGAHYDHLGLGGQFSLAPSLTGTVHPGADDNASGTAGVIELARWYATQPKQKRGILFLSFAGEEQGLLGSAYYAGHPKLPLEKAVAMINMDMIGRIRDAKVYVGGAASGSTLRPLLEQISPNYSLKLDFAGTGASDGSSDHTSFQAKQVPILFFFSGLHGDYHKPSDTWDKIDTADAATLLQLVADVADHLRDAPERPKFVRVAPASGHGDSSVGPVGGNSGYGPNFGSVPDFAEGINGVKFADVREGSPAAKAGFKAGDILVEFDGKPIQNLYDFTYALRSKKAGDTVKVKVLRGGAPVEAQVLLTKRE
ncbi:MAG TPA: M28 family peptidase [Candidatus Acidoferrales bacterium]|jgi:Zn-dependent M28 family amino/carboxypeptidase|nr:M28 family peptidase [Candidatus Acidoferrales bacterium]